MNPWLVTLQQEKRGDKYLGLRQPTKCNFSEVSEISVRAHCDSQSSIILAAIAAFCTTKLPTPNSGQHGSFRN